MQTMRCIITKDLRCELRARMTFASIALLGVLLVLALEIQADLPTETKQGLIGGSLWLAVFIAGTLGMERSFSDETNHGCFDALRMYAVSPSAIYMAKLLFNFALLMAVTAILILLFTVLADPPWFEHSLAMLLISLLGNLSFSAIGTLVAALVNRVRSRGSLLTLVLLPLVLPVLLAAGEATRLTIANDLHEEFWRWLQLLAAFAVIFITAAVLIFEFIMED
jgi:heme exporter protein B